MQFISGEQRNRYPPPPERASISKAHLGPNKPLPDAGAQWLSGRVIDLRPRGHGFEPHRRHCVVVLEQDTFILAQYWFNPGRPVPV